MPLLQQPNPERIFYVKDALKEGLSMTEIFDLTKIAFGGFVSLL